jgi:hypothetical protein
MAGDKTAGAQGHTDSAAGKTTETTLATGAVAAGAEGEPSKTAAAGKGDTTAAAAGAEGARGTAGAEPGGKAAEVKAEAKAPEKYVLTVPDDAAAFVDDADLKYLKDAARKAGWSNEDAQAALEEHVATVKAQSDRWAAETTADSEYGGDRLVETQRLARAVIDRVRPAGHARRDPFLRFLGRGGAGNHVEVISFLADLGKLMGEDAPGHSRATGAESKEPAKRLYDHPTSITLDASRGA